MERSARKISAIVVSSNCWKRPLPRSEIFSENEKKKEERLQSCGSPCPLLPSPPTSYFSHRRYHLDCLTRRFSIPSRDIVAVASQAARKIDTWAPNGPTKTDPTGTRQQKRMHIMNGWTRRRRNGCQKYIASVHPLSNSCTRGPDIATGRGWRGQKKRGGGAEAPWKKRKTRKEGREERETRWKTTEIERSRKTG